VSFLETREGRRAAARTNPAARDFMRDNPNAWRVVGPSHGHFGDRCGLTTHRGAVHPHEYVNPAAVRSMVERRVGFTVEQVRSVYSTGGRIPAERRALRAAIDARLLALAQNGTNMDLLGHALGVNGSTLDRALARARACAPDTTRAAFDVDKSVNTRGVIELARKDATPLDHGAIAAGLGELKAGNGYDRLVVGGKTVAYLKQGRVAVPTALVAKAPTKLGTFTPEKSGPWSNAAVDTTAKARAIVEYIVAKAAA
jgi:hypothetical protein